MDNIEISKTEDWHCYLFRFAYGSNAKYPKDFCSYWWKLVVALLLLPFYGLGGLVIKIQGDNYKDMPERFGYTIATLVMAFMAIVAGALTNDLIVSLIYGGVATEHLKWLFILFFVGDLAIVLAIALVIAVVVGFIGLVVLCMELIKIRIAGGTEKGGELVKPSLAYTKFKSFKEKHCSIIDWKE